MFDADYKLLRAGMRPSVSISRAEHCARYNRDTQLIGGVILIPVLIN